MLTPAEALKTSTERFVKNAREHVDVVLDGSLKSLILVSAAMQKYHAMYERAAAAKDPDLDKFARQVSTEATAYVSSIFVSSFQAKLGATKEGKIILIVSDVSIPIGEMMLDELKSGKPHSLLLIAQVDNIAKKNLQPQEVDPDQVESESRAHAAVAVQDVRGMLKQELDYTLESLTLVDRALQRLKAIAEVSPESKSNLVRASRDKYGSYIGEVLAKHRGGKWLKIKVRDTVVNAVSMGSIYVMPSLIVEAVIEGRKLDMGDKAAESVVQFVAISEERLKSSSPEGLFRNLDTPGEVLKRIPLLAEEGVRIAKVSHGIELDYSLFSLSALDEVITKHHQKLEEERKILNEENFQRARAFAALPFGVYLGETILRAHGGSWEDANPWPKLRQHMMKFDPITIISAFLRGETATTTEKTKAASPQQYYQGIRPLLHDILLAKVYGSGKTKEQVLGEMGPSHDLNSAVLHFAEACVAFAYSECAIELDFSENSLGDVDRMLEQFHKNTEEEIKARPALDRENLIKWFGCYSGEVFRRTIGGIWADDASGTVPPGPGIAHLRVGGNRIFVLNKVGKFLRNGSADSVAFLLHSVRSMIKSGKLSVPQ